MHYVRAGDFVRSLLRNARTPDELAFAIGALTHYVGDNIGHSEAVNLSVPVEFPNLEKKYGHSVNYGEDPYAHVRTEFAFDINELTKRRMAPSAYLHHVGLYVATDLFRRSFYETYGIDIKRLFIPGHPIVRGYAFAVRSFLPRIAYAEAVLHRNSFPPDTSSEQLDKLKNSIAQADYENGWDKYRKKAGFLTYSMAGIIYILPKIGTLSELSIRGPNQQTQDLYVESLNQTIDTIRMMLAHFDQIDTYLPNRDLDTGLEVNPGGYRLTDKTYAHLLTDITRHPERAVPLHLQHDIIAYYADPNAPISTKKHHDQWAQVQANLKVLATMRTTADPDPDGDATPVAPSNNR